jgi:hypothetical protein
MGVESLGPIFGPIGYSLEKISPSEYGKIDERQSQAAKKSSELGIEVSPENINAIIEQR